jgi:hypothetical protein
MKRIFAVVLLCVGMMNFAFARVGDTVEKCVERYGKPTQGAEDSEKKSFEKNGISIALDFRDGVAVAANYQGKAGWGNLLGKLSEEQIKEILKIYEEGKAWEPIASGIDAIARKDLRRADGALLACWDYATGSVSFITPGEKEKRKAEAAIAAEQVKEAEKKTVEGL